MIVNNCGEHVLGIIVDGKIMQLPYSGTCARVNFEQVKVGEIDGIPIYQNTTGTIKGLPHAASEDTVYVTSRLVAEHVKRLDVCCPNTAPGHVIRDVYGMPIAVDSLLTYGAHTQVHAHVREKTITVHSCGECPYFDKGTCKKSGTRVNKDMLPDRCAIDK